MNVTPSAQIRSAIPDTQIPKHISRCIICLFITAALRATFPPQLLTISFWHTLDIPENVYLSLLYPKALQGFFFSPLASYLQGRCNMNTFFRDLPDFNFHFFNAKSCIALAGVWLYFRILFPSVTFLPRN